MQHLLGIESRVVDWGGRSSMPPMVIYKMPGGVEPASVTPLLEEDEPTPARPYVRIFMYTLGFTLDVFVILLREQRDSSLNTPMNGLFERNWQNMA